MRLAEGNDAMITQSAAVSNPHYDSAYFKHQKMSGEYSGVIDLFKFSTEVTRSDRVVDFGCGGGYILANLLAREKIGVEVNEAAAAMARSKGLTIVPALDLLEDGWADVIISHHALEHVDDPLGVVTSMLAKLRTGGKVVIVTPVESYTRRFREEDPNFHLFTWSPSNLGNLLKRAGFVRISATTLYHRWPPYWYLLKEVLGLRLMHVICVLHGRLRTEMNQAKAVAYKP